MEQSGGSVSEMDKVLSPSELQLMRLVICGLRAAARAASASRQTRGSLEAAACRVIARQAGKKHEDVHGLWCNFRASSLRKVRAHLARGDITAPAEQLSTLEWAAVDLLLLYETPLLSVASFHQRAQLAALERTFELVLRFQLESENGEAVSPEQWSRAANCYCKNGVVLSAVALQRRWYELKLDTRQRACAPHVPGTPRPLLVPIHEAVATRYPHVVNSRELLTWRELVAAGKVAEPTSEHGPAPGETPVDAALTHDADKSIETIDLLDDDEGENNAHNEAPCEPPVDTALTHDAEKSIETIDLLDDDEGENNAHNEAPCGTSNITPVNTTDKELIGSENTKRKSTRNMNQNKNTATKKVLSKNIDIKIKPEIIEIDDDAPSPKENIIEAIQDTDLNNVDATIVYESDEEDVKTIIDLQMGNVGKHVEAATVVKENSENSNISKEIVINSTLYQEVNVESNWNYCQNMANISDEDTTIDTEEHSRIKIEELSASDEKDVDCSSPDLNNQIENVRHVKQGNRNVNINSEIVNNSIVCDNLDKVAEQLKDKIREKYCVVPLAQNKDTSVSNTSQESTGIPGIDPKLLMFAVVLLRRIDDPIETIDKPPLPIHRQSLNVQESSSKTSYSGLFCKKKKEMTYATGQFYSRSYYEQNKARLFYEKNIPRSFYEKNKTLLKQCKPCMVLLRRADEEGGRNMGAEGRKRVRLPDMEKVKRNNRGVLTAEVAPLMPTQSATMIKRVRPNPTYSDQSATASSQTIQASAPNPLQNTFRPMAPPPWARTPTPGRQPEPSSLLEHVLVGNTSYQNSSVIDPALQQNYFISPPTRFNLLQSQDGSLLQNQSSQSQLQNLNVPLQGFMSNPMLAPNTNWQHGLQQNIANNWPQTQGTQNICTNLFPPVLQAQDTTTTATGYIPTPNMQLQNMSPQNVTAQNISTQNLAPQNICTSEFPPVLQAQEVTGNIPNPNIDLPCMSPQNVTTQKISTQNVTVQKISRQNIATQNIAMRNISPHNVAVQNQTPETQNSVTADEDAASIATRNISQNTAVQSLSTQNVAAQNIQVQNLTTQNISSQNMATQKQNPEIQNVITELAAAIVTQNIAMQNISTQNIEMQNISTQNITTPKILIPNWGFANMAGVLSLTQTNVNQPSLTIDGTLLAQSFQGVILEQPATLNQFITNSQPNPFIMNPVSCVNTAPTPVLMNPQLNQTIFTNQALLCGSEWQIIQPTPEGPTSVAQTNAEGSTNNQITQQTPIEGTSDASVPMDVDGETNVSRDGVLKTTEQVNLLQVVPIENLFEMMPKKNRYSSTANKKRLYKRSSILDWSLFPLSPFYLIKDRKMNFKHVLCTGPGQGWRLNGHLVVSDQQKPPPVAAIWSLRPRVRLQLPTPDEDSKDAKAAPNVLFRDKLYQKLSDSPLTYAMILVAVDSAATCQQLLSSGATLQLYCLQTGILHPIQAQRLDNGSFILSGAADIESPLAELTRRLHPPAPAPPPAAPAPAAPAAPSAPILRALISAAPRRLAAQPVPEVVATAPMLSALISAARRPPVPKSTFESVLSSPLSELSELVPSTSTPQLSVTSESEPSSPPPPSLSNPDPSGLIPSAPSEGSSPRPVVSSPPAPSAPNPTPKSSAPKQLTSTPTAPGASPSSASVPTSWTAQIKPPPNTTHPQAEEKLSTAIRPTLNSSVPTKPVTTVTALVASLLSSVPSESTAQIQPVNNTQAEPKPTRRRPKLKPPATTKHTTSVPALVTPPSVPTKMTAQIPLANTMQSEPKPAPKRPKLKPPAPTKQVTTLIAQVGSALIASVTPKSIAQIPPAVKRPTFKPSILRPPTSKSLAPKHSASKLTTSNPSAPNPPTPKQFTPTTPKSETSASNPTTLKTSVPVRSSLIPPDLLQATSTAKQENTQYDWDMLSEADFVANYRLPKRRVRALANELGPVIPNHCIKKILSCLRYLATDTARPLAGASQVIDALNHHTFINKYITFPLQSEAQERVTHRFKQRYELRNVLGVVDGLHIALHDLPPAHEDVFLNRAGFHSLNVQLICDADLNILSVDNSQGGCVHDCAIWAAHPVHLQLQRLHKKGERVYLLGDSGYLQRETLMTPFPTPSSPYETLYNFLHSRAWSSIKQCTHMLRRRWKRLTIPLPENKARKIINACAVLHNMAQQCNAPVLLPDVDLEKQKREDALLEEQQESAVVSLVTAPNRQRLLREWKKGVAARNLLVESLKSTIESGLR